MSVTTMSPTGTARLVRRQAEQRRWAFAALGVAVCAVILAGIGLGPVRISPGQIFSIAAQSLGLNIGIPYEAHHEAVMASIRVPRVVLGILVGISLATAGATMQALFRNPLADPGLVGISGGAAMAAVFTIVAGSSVLPMFVQNLGPYALPVAAFAGALAATFLIFRIAAIDGVMSVPTMLLAGIAVNALAMAVVGYLTFISDDQQLRMLTFWSLGSLASASWSVALPSMMIMVFATCALLRLARPLNGFLLGEHEALHLGVNVKRLKRQAVILVALAVGAAVSVTGMIGFVGLVVPHLVRLVTGPDHRFVLPGSALLGAALLVSADLVARLSVVPAELPIGVVTSAIGAPFFIGLLLNQKRKMAIS